jgi:hypothetical protein
MAKAHILSLGARFARPVLLRCYSFCVLPIWPGNYNIDVHLWRSVGTPVCALPMWRGTGWRRPQRGLRRRLLSLRPSLAVNTLPFLSVWQKVLHPAKMTKYKSHQSPFKPRGKFILSHLGDSSRAILGILEENPFSSVREFARATSLPLATVHKRLTN